MKRSVALLITIIMMAAASLVTAETGIRCASTTSTQNSGLFDYILPLFKEKTGIRVDVVAVGTGAAIEIGKRGDTDVVFVHAKELELKAVEQGYFVDREDVMYNDFVLIGPPQDPAGIKGIPSASDALKRIADKGSLFVSRGDTSGTHMKELSVWEKAGVIPAGRKWYLEAGQGMAKTQRIANEKRAYTLTDRGTWLALKDRDTLEMSILLEGDPVLFNQYGIMAVNPARHSHVKYKEAKRFIRWLVSEEGQRVVSDFKDIQGNRLFTPNAKQKNSTIEE
jgi:tungstate transport system substrate-binding protein